VADEHKAKVAAVADASFLIGVCVIDQVSLLGEMFEPVYVAPAVWEEVVDRGQGRPGAEQIENAPFVMRQEVQNRQSVVMLQLFLGPGERETLALAQELSCSLVLMDDLRARRVANQAGMHTLGVVGLLLDAKRHGLISQVRPFLETLRARGFRLGQALVEAALRDAGET
jgi:predicted nucleic acid-binding protein